MVWPRCEYQNGSWGNEPIDSFWVECTQDEAARLIFPRLSPEQQEQAMALYDEKVEPSPNTFVLIAQDLSSIQPMEPHYPYGNLWNAYSPFRAIVPLKIHNLDELRNLDVVALMVGPQSSGDPPFTKRMRFHQSWYRANRLGVLYGTGPSASSVRPYGHMLPAEAADEGWNFLSPAIFTAAQQRMARKTGVVEPFRLLHNMLASQAMCFNLFGPFVAEPESMTALVRAVVPDEVDRVTRVEVEYAPEPTGEYLADKTAFDAFIEYMRPDRRLAFVGIETKLTEPFSPTRHGGDRYREFTQQPGSPWLPEAWPAVADKAHNQLWRDHLLVQAMLRHPDSHYASGRLVLVRHPQDTTCAKVVAGYRALLKPGDDTINDLHLDRLVAAWKSAVPESQEPGRAWLGAVEERYLRLEDSEADWQRWKSRASV